MAGNRDQALRLELGELLANKRAAYEFLREYTGLEIAAKIRNLRETHDLTQEDIANLLETTQSAVARWENEDYRKYSLSTLQRIAEAFNLWPTVRFEDHEIVLDRILAGRDSAEQGAEFTSGILTTNLESIIDLHDRNTIAARESASEVSTVKEVVTAAT